MTLSLIRSANAFQFLTRGLALKDQQEARDRAILAEVEAKLARDRSETARDRSETARTGAEAAKDVSVASAAAAAENAASSAASNAQAELAAIAAGAPLFTEEPALPGAPSPYLLKVDAGLQVFTHDGTVRTFLGWLGRVEFDNPGQLLAYPLPLGPVGTVLGAGGFRYRIAPAVVTDENLVTAGGVKLYVLPGDGIWYNFAAWNPAGDGLTDDYPKLRNALNIRRALSGNWLVGPSLMLPAKEYFCSQTIELKAVTALVGEVVGQRTQAVGTSLKFPAGVKGIVINRFNTFVGATESIPTTAADQSRIEHLRLIGVNNRDRVSHGIDMRARATIYDVNVINFGGHGICIIGNQGPIEGNANLFRLNEIRCEGNGNWGVFVDGGDANAGTGYGINCSGNARGGIWDSSFLNNTWTACHTANNGLPGLGGNGPDETAVVHLGGRLYCAAASATEAQLVATVPGTNPAVWFDQEAGTQTAAHPTWKPDMPVGTYFKGYPYYADGTVNTSLFIGCYVEGGQAVPAFDGRSSSFGGAMPNKDAAYSPQFYRLGKTQRLTGGFEALPYSTTMFGKVAFDSGALSFGDTREGAQWDVTFNGTDWLFRHGSSNSRVAMSFTGATTAQTMGTAASQPYTALFSKIALGTGGSIRRQFVGAGPSAIEYGRGDIIWTPSASPSGRAGMICTIAGLGGSTAVFKSFAPIDA